jgi:hypothetical protein
MNADNCSYLIFPISFQTRSAENMSTRKDVLWSFEETTPTSVIISWNDHPAFAGRSVKEILEGFSMHLCCSSFF